MDLIMTVNYPSSSPYSATPQTSWYLKNWVFRAIPPDSNDQYVTLQQYHQYRPDILSYELYGTYSYYWVFAIRNPELRKDPIWSFVPGAVVICPSLDYLKRIIG